MATNVGKVGIVMKGNWSNSATYEVLDAVTYNNALYIAKQAVPANTTPTNTTYWQAALYPTVDASNSFTLESEISGNVDVLVYGKIVILAINISGTFEASSNITLGNLPAGLNSPRNIMGVLVGSSGSAMTTTARVLVRQNNASVLISTIGAASFLQGQVVYTLQ